MDDGKNIFESDVIRIYILKNETLTLIVFVSLRAFQQSSCVFYLIIMTIVDTIHLFTGLFTYIMINGIGINLLNMSRFYVQLCVLISFSCIYSCKYFT